MRIVVLGVSVFLLGACATVSMTPGAGTVTAEATASQTALRMASDAYCENSEQKGWVAKTSNLFGLARLLMHGNKDGATSASPDYAEQIGAGSVEASVVFARITHDTNAARIGLADVSHEAHELLASDETGIADHTDVMSYERALVSAQKSYRSFATAADIAASDTIAAPAETDEALTGFAAEIDSARTTADLLADQYASLTRSVT